jgi:hypothetical protein
MILIFINKVVAELIIHQQKIDISMQLQVVKLGLARLCISKNQYFKTYECLYFTVARE